MPVRKPAPEPGPEPVIETTIAPPEMPNLKLPEDYIPLDRPEPYDYHLFSDWWEFVRNVPNDAPYDILNQLPFHRGFVYKITEQHVSVHEQSMTVMFQILIGRTMDDLRHLDNFTVQVPRNTVAPSLAARSIAMPTVIYTIFGRLPPEQPPIPAPQPAPAAQQPAPQPAPKPVAREPEPEPEELPWKKEPVRPRRQPLPDNLIRERTMDGLPVYIDLYELDVDTNEAVERLIDAFEDEVGKISDVPQLRALYSVNKEDTVGAVQYIQDFGTPDQLQRLRSIFGAREQQISRRR